MKKIIGLLLALVMVCSVTCVVLADPEGATLSVTPSVTEATEDNEVVFTVSLSNAAVAKSGGLNFSYDSNVFDLVSGDWLLTGAMLANFDTAKNAAAIAYTTATDMNGDIFTLKLKVKEGATIGSTTVTATPTIKNGATTISCAAASASVTINCKTHTPGEATRENVVDATCGVAGSYDEVVKCTVCGAEISRTQKTIDATGKHTAGTPVNENVVPATCGKDGSHDEVVYCTVCNAELERTTKTDLATGNHTPGTPVNENVVPATCGKDGSHDEVVYCSVCGYKISSEHKTDLATGLHTPGTPVNENVVPATCGKDGSHDEVVYCSVCGYKISSEHKTDLATGEHNYEWKYDSDYHWQECTDCHSMPDGTESEEHKFEMKTVEEPTFEKEGLKKEVCTVCGYESGKTETINKLEKAESTTSDDTTNEDGTKNSVVKSDIPASKLNKNNIKVTINVDGEEITVPDEYIDVTGDENGTTVSINQAFYATNPKFVAGTTYTATITGDGVGTVADLKVPEAAAATPTTGDNNTSSTGTDNKGTASTTGTTDSGKTDTTTSSPKTADTDIAFLVIALLAVMGSSVFAGVTYRKKRNNK